jgi:hypothetical protein
MTLYCERCRKEKKWPNPDRTRMGYCEVCGCIDECHYINSDILHKMLMGQKEDYQLSVEDVIECVKIKISDIDNEIITLKDEIRACEEDITCFRLFEDSAHYKFITASMKAKEVEIAELERSKETWEEKLKNFRGS